MNSQIPVPNINTNAPRRVSKLLCPKAPIKKAKRVPISEKLEAEAGLRLTAAMCLASLNCNSSVIAAVSFEMKRQMKPAICRRLLFDLEYAPIPITPPYSH